MKAFNNNHSRPITAQASRLKNINWPQTSKNVPLISREPGRIFLRRVKWKRVVGAYEKSGPEVIKLFFMLNSAEHEICPVTNLRLLTTANSVLLNIAEHEIVSANKYENANYCWHFHIY